MVKEFAAALLKLFLVECETIAKSIVI